MTTIEKMTPAEVAHEELLQILDATRYTVGFVRSEAELRQLWQIDCEAYDHNISFELFSKWWSAYNNGSICLFVRKQIVASMGIYPLSQEQTRLFSSGQILEADLVPDLGDRSTWYVSGCVIVPEYRNKGLVRPLVRLGFGAWLTRENLPHEIRLLALGESQTGRKLLKRSGFALVKPGAEMPDHSDLFECRTTPDKMLSLVKTL